MAVAYGVISSVAAASQTRNIGNNVIINVTRGGFGAGVIGFIKSVAANIGGSGERKAIISAA